jgi:hypothetical protein
MIILRKIKQSTDIVIGEVLSGDLNGANRTFNTSYPFKSNQIQVTYNGQVLHPDSDFTINSTTSIIFNYISPHPDDVVCANYEKEVT